MSRKKYLNNTKTYNRDDKFCLIGKGEKKKLIDDNSSANAYVIIQAIDDEVYFAEAEKIVNQNYKQKVTDYIVNCKKQKEVNFIELKGENISGNKAYNPFAQINQTIDAMLLDKKLGDIISSSGQKYAFIVSPGRQSVPRNIESLKRVLWIKLKSIGSDGSMDDLIKMVKMVSNGRCNDKTRSHLECSNKFPLCMPFQL